MEFLNKIELQGVVGSAKLTKIQDKNVCKFSVVTEMAHTMKDSEAFVIETTWFNCTAFESKTISNDVLNSITKGSKVHLVGRMKTTKYVALNGEDSTLWEVICSSLNTID